MTLRRFIAALVALFAGTPPAHAHLVGVEFGDFYAGALHLALAPENLAAAAALGVVAAVQPREAARWMLLALPIGLAVGVGAAFAFGAPLIGQTTSTDAATNGVDPTLGALIAVSLALPGALGAAALRLPIWALAGAATVVGLVQGFVNGLAGHEAPVDWSLYAPGVIVAGVTIGTLAIAIVVAVIALAAWAQIAGRVVGSWVAAAGFVFLGLSLAT